MMDRVNLNEKEPEPNINILEWLSEWLNELPQWFPHLLKHNTTGIWSCFTLSRSAQGLLFYWAGAWWFRLPCLNLIQPDLQRLEPKLSPPATRNKNQAPLFLVLSQKTQKQKGQHGHCFQIYVTRSQIMSCIPRAEQAWNFCKSFPTHNIF